MVSYTFSGLRGRPIYESPRLYVGVDSGDNLHIHVGGKCYTNDELSGLCPTAEQLAKRFHEAYERLAPQFGYETRKESAVPWQDVPENNKRLMIAVCAEILD